ncbi:MAG: hypothetical protein JRC77_11095 [Deltaproteobacteria bacterium]|nr:hypothetical protein [Deltaproteobacteria bacterium]
MAFDMPVEVSAAEPAVAVPEEEPVVSVFSVQDSEFADVGALINDAMSTEVVAEVVPEEVIQAHEEALNADVDVISGIVMEMPFADVGESSPLPAIETAKTVEAPEMMATAETGKAEEKTSPPAALPSVAIVVDGDRRVAEWAKRSLQDRIRTIHLFEKLDPAMQRTRQYLKRGELPLVILSCDFKDMRGFVTRLHKMAPKIRVIGLASGNTTKAVREAVEAVLQKPSTHEVEDSSASAKCAGLGKALIRSLTG